MARGKIDPEVLAHVEWINFVRPTGLVVSAPALVRAGAILDRRDIEGQHLLRECVVERVIAKTRDTAPFIASFSAFARRFLGWSFSPAAYAGTGGVAIPDELEILLPDGEILRPDFAVRELEPKDGASGWQLLVSVLPDDADFDGVASDRGALELPPHGRMERLLRQKRVPAGVLFNGTVLRLISAPHRESSGWIDFRVADMVQTAGRPISTALRLLLSEARLLSLPRQQRFAALLDDSRKFQTEVSERLAEQVLHALYELLRGFQAAQDATKGELLKEQLDEHPDEIYRALLTVILRLVFVLYAEERDMFPGEGTWLRYYSLAGLYERLLEDAALYPDTMDQRFGAWAQLLVLFRMIHDGAAAGDMHLPRRNGVLFDPDRFKFLEGRPLGGSRQIHEGINPPLVPDGTIYRALEKLLVLDGERISYRALDVEQIGSVYETMMGFRLEKALGPSVAIRAQKKHGAPTAVSLDAMLAEPSTKREKWLLERADRKLTDTLKRTVAAASTLDDLHAALLPIIDLAASPDIVPSGAMVFQPSEERRRSGSHYTPRSLTEPIVRSTLEPILARLHGDGGQVPRPEQILDLKVCDPAMGSGAFLVEACRQLGAALVESWHMHEVMPTIPADEREDLFAMRLVSQRCIYGVDRNPIAVDLAKMSLWLVTLAKEHALTFLDHALRHGDSLVGLSRQQIEAFHWDSSKHPHLHGLGIRDSLDTVIELRRQIREAGDDVTDWELRDLWDQAQFALRGVRLIGDLVVAAFFDADKPKDREAKRLDYLDIVAKGQAEAQRAWLEERRQGDHALVQFHWQIEFPEVFERLNRGFDSIVGNPPFAGVTTLASTHASGYTDWLRTTWPGTGGKCDLVGFFFRETYELLRGRGTLGLIATKSISQGDTRSSSLEPILSQGGTIYRALRRLQWPGSANVIVSVLHIAKGDVTQTVVLDGRNVARISAFLYERGGDSKPAKLFERAGEAFLGCKPNGKGFLFQDGRPESTPLDVARELIRQVEDYSRVVRPYLGGSELNDDPHQTPSRAIIDFDGISESEARGYPAVFAIAEQKIKPFVRRTTWWQYEHNAEQLRVALRNRSNVLVCAESSNAFGFVFQPTDRVFSNKIVVFLFHEHTAFSVLQSRVHEVWARLFSSTTAGDNLSYVPGDCFESFPFPSDWRLMPSNAGREYYEFRADVMTRNNEGLTKTYNRFHDPNESQPDILKLRELHAVMDRAVLDAYGWTDIAVHCKFVLDYEIDEEEWGTKRKPLRYRWPDEVRDEVLARLLELNGERAREEAFIGNGLSARKRGSVTVASQASDQGRLL